MEMVIQRRPSSHRYTERLHSESFLAYARGDTDALGISTNARCLHEFHPGASAVYAGCDGMPGSGCRAGGLGERERGEEKQEGWRREDGQGRDEEDIGETCTTRSKQTVNVANTYRDLHQSHEWKVG